MRMFGSNREFIMFLCTLKKHLNFVCVFLANTKSRVLGYSFVVMTSCSWPSCFTHEKGHILGLGDASLLLL